MLVEIKEHWSQNLPKSTEEEVILPSFIWVLLAENILIF